MRKSRFSETQIVGILRDAESGVPVPDLLRTHGVGKATFFKWRSKYGGACLSRPTTQTSAITSGSRTSGPTPTMLDVCKT